VCPPPHTDIDACFRIIAEYLYSIGLVRNIEEYLSGIKLAWARGEHADHVHVEKLDVIFDYKTWLDPHVYNSDGVTLKAADEKAQARARPNPRSPTRCSTYPDACRAVPCRCQVLLLRATS
jgi:hypothetical protein